MAIHPPTSSMGTRTNNGAHSYCDSQAPRPVLRLVAFYNALHLQPNTGLLCAGIAAIARQTTYCDFVRLFRTAAPLVNTLRPRANVGGGNPHIARHGRAEQQPQIRSITSNSTRHNHGLRSNVGAGVRFSAGQWHDSRHVRREPAWDMSKRTTNRPVASNALGQTFSAPIMAFTTISLAAGPTTSPETHECLVHQRNAGRHGAHRLAKARRRFGLKLWDNNQLRHPRQHAESRRRWATATAPGGGHSPARVTYHYALSGSNSYGQWSNARMSPFTTSDRE